MDSHVKLRQSELHGALVTFSQVDARITGEFLHAVKTYSVFTIALGAQKKVQNLKKSLLDCRTLLQCKRDDLKRLWAEDMKYKKILNELHLMLVAGCYNTLTFNTLQDCLRCPDLHVHILLV